MGVPRIPDLDRQPFRRALVVRWTLDPPLYVFVALEIDEAPQQLLRGTCPGTTDETGGEEVGVVQMGFKGLAPTVVGKNGPALG